MVQLKDSNGAQVFGNVFLQILKCISTPPNYNKLQLKHAESGGGRVTVPSHQKVGTEENTVPNMTTLQQASDFFLVLKHVLEGGDCIRLNNCVHTAHAVLSWKVTVPGQSPNLVTLMT